MPPVSTRKSASAPIHCWRTWATSEESMFGLLRVGSRSSQLPLPGASRRLIVSTHPLRDTSVLASPPVRLRPDPVRELHGVEAAVAVRVPDLLALRGERRARHRPV